MSVSIIQRFTRKLQDRFIHKLLINLVLGKLTVEDLQI